MEILSVSSPVVFADHFDCKDHIPSARGMGLWGLNTFWAGDLREWGVVTGERLAIDIPSSSTFFSVLLNIGPWLHGSVLFNSGAGKDCLTQYHGVVFKFCPQLKKKIVHQLS